MSQNKILHYLIKDPCAKNKCYNGGKCNNLSKLTFSCTCNAGYTGRQCEIGKKKKEALYKVCPIDLKLST